MIQPFRCWLADLAADAGHRIANKGEEQCILTYLASTQSSYVKLTKRFQSFALAILEADKTARDDKGFIPLGKTATVQWLSISAQAPQRPPFLDGSGLEFLEIPRDNADDAQIHQFWKADLNVFVQASSLT